MVESTTPIGGIQSKKDAWDLDTVLGYGRYHHFQIWFIQALIAVIGAFNYYHMFLIVVDPPHWTCKNPDVEKCPDGGKNSSISIDDYHICEGGEVVFNTSHQNHLHSLVVERRWLCTDKILGAGVITAFYVGMIINSLVFGQLCDKWGRKPVFHITNVLFIVCRMLSFHMTDHYVIFLALTALGTGFFPVGVRAGYTIVAEICDENGRKYAFISGWVWWVVGLAFLPFMAKWSGDWYTFGLLTTLINILLLLLYPLLPESPRWLMGQGKFQEAAQIVERMRKINRDPPIPNLPEVLEKLAVTQEQSQNVLFSIFKKKSLIMILVCTAIIWSVNDYFYIAGSINAENLAGDMFLNISLLALTETPSVFIGQFLTDRFGRRWTHTCCMVIATIPMAVCSLIAAEPSQGTNVIIFTIISKSASNVGWFIMWVQSIEVFPTAMRGTGINIAVMFSTVVSMTGPYVVDLGTVDKRYPFFVFTLFGLIGTVTTTLIPETKGNSLPERFEDIDQMLKTFKYFSWRTWPKEDDQSQKEDNSLSPN